MCEREIHILSLRMDPKCSQLLPSVCTLLADPGCPVSDDTCLEKLLDWFKTLTSSPGSVLLLLEENPCLTELILAVLSQGEPNPGILSFILRLTGMFAASESGFQHLQQGELVFVAFGEAGPLGSKLWEDMTVRSGWVQGVYTMMQHYSAFQFLCNSGALDVIFSLQGDRSLFIASGANRLLTRTLVFSVQSEPSRLLSPKDGDWPACARMIVTRVEDSLRSHSASSVQRSLKLLATLFDHNQDPWTEILWSRIAETVGSVLMEDSAQAGHSLVDLFLSMAKSPAFSCPECSLWKLVTLALKNLSLAQSGPLALGLLKLESCPPAIKTQSLNVLLQPMDWISRAASDSHLQFPGLPDAPSTHDVSMEFFLSSRSLCISLVCQTLAHLEEIQSLAYLSEGNFPHKPLLHSVMAALKFCIGSAVPVSSPGATLAKTLVGCSRVQRAALGLLGTLSRWAIEEETMEQVFDILLVYLKSPDTSGTVLKKAFQATLKWLQGALEPSTPPPDLGRQKQFLQDVLPEVQKRMCSPCWEVRDSALEFLTLLMKHLKGQEWFCRDLLSLKVPSLVEGLLDDPESYVRASAVKALGQFSLMASPDSDHNGSHKEASLGVRLLDILATDSEGFPRRAVIGVFAEWLKESHREVMADPEQFVSKALQAASGDLDWEVKVTALELVEIFAAQTFLRLGSAERPEAGDSLPASLQTLCRVKAFEFLFGAVRDCDRPVALKACEVLLNVKSKICRDIGQEQRKTLELGDAARPEGTPGGASPSALICRAGDFAERLSQDPERLPLILNAMDLEGLQRFLDVSSDHLEQSPQSLLQDILSAAGSTDENKADCY